MCLRFLENEITLFERRAYMFACNLSDLYHVHFITRYNIIKIMYGVCSLSVLTSHYENNFH